MQIAYCDDDKEMLEEIDRLLVEYRALQSRALMCEAFSSPLELLAEVEKGMRPDILILDVIMPGENGINVAREIRQHDNNVKIIFLTSSAEFAVDSYKVDAYFYQLKPICAEDFFQLLDEVISECEKLPQESLVLRCKNGITKINLDRLVYCEVIGHTLIFHLENGKVLESIGALDELYAKLSQYDNFMRPHRSFLINMDYVQNISYKVVIMDDLTEIPIPHGKCSEIKNKYLEYAFNRKQFFWT